MVCQLLNLTYYLHVCYAILDLKGMGSGAQAKPDGCNLTTTIVIQKLSKLPKTLILGRIWLIWD